MVLSAIGAAFGSITHIFNLFSFAGGLFAAYMLDGSKLLASSDLADFAVSEDEACAVFCALFLLCALSMLFALLGDAPPDSRIVRCNILLLRHRLLGVCRYADPCRHA